MLTVTSKYYQHIIVILTVANFQKKCMSRKINKKKSREAWENKSRKGDIGT